MELYKIFKDGIRYPLQNLTKLLILGILFCIGGIHSTQKGILFYILTIFGIVISLFTSGYILSITQESINNSDSLPQFKFLKNVIYGLKLAILEIIYGIIYLFITIITICIIIGPSVITTLYQSNPTELSNLIPSIGFNSLGIVGIIIILLILFLIGILNTIGMCRLSKSGKILDGLSFIKIINDIKSIGTFKFIIGYITLFISLAFLTIILVLISLIPIIGIFIVALIGIPFMTIFYSRIIGLLYSESKY